MAASTATPSAAAERLLVPAASGSARTAPDVRVELLWRLAPLGLAILASLTFLWNLTASGFANTYYSAAAQAASQSWAAMFFGAIDAGGFITVDKPPAALWLMGLSVRLFGLNSLAVLLPEALAGVASVLVLFATVRRQLGREAALIAGVTFTLTPVTALMFRYNNPEALLVLLLVAAAWCVVRGLEDGRLRWPLLAAVLVGFAFLTKYLQAYVVLPAFMLTWLVAAPGSVRRRLGQLVVAGLVVLASSFWWIAIVDLMPAAARPYVGGSRNNSAMDLVLGYDGLGRIFGGGVAGGRGGVPGGVQGGIAPGTGAFGSGGFGGSPGLLRMFNAQWAGEISWLLPTAAVGLVAGLAARFRAKRTDPRRAAFILWGTWAVVHVLVFSMMSGIAHPYYAVAIAPAAAALTGGGIMELWRARARVRWASLVLGAVLVLTATWGWQLLERTPAFWPGVGIGALSVAVAAGLMLVASSVADDSRSSIVSRVALGLGLAAILVGPVLYTAETIRNPISGGDPSSGPVEARAGFGNGRFPGAGPGAFPGAADLSSAELVSYLVENRGDATWLLAVGSANEAAPLQLASGVPVMAMGGFSGSDPALTLDALQSYVREGKLRYVMVSNGGHGGRFGGGGQDDAASARNDWITSTCTAAPGLSVTIYDCAGAG